MADLTVTVPPTIVMVAKVQPRENPQDLPKYDTWRIVDTLRVVGDIFIGTSIVGHSSARLALFSGQPDGPQIDIEKGRDILALGDRVAIGLKRNPKLIDWQFCGYVVSNQLAVDDKSERCIWKVAGPEWWWGDNSAASGSGLAVYGQMRRVASADDEWSKDQEIETGYGYWDLFTDERCVFNPNGKRNMTRDDVILSNPKRKDEIKGPIWESPDRRIDEDNVAIHWDILDAAKVIVEAYSDSLFSGIASPDWFSLPMTFADKMPETIVEGESCYSALHKILGNKFAFWINPRPTYPDGKPINVIKGNDWGPFQLHFFQRDKGEAANLVLNKRGTSMLTAQASVTRLEVARDISKCPNKVFVQGAYVRQVKLIYWGGYTPELPDAKKKTALQNGWKSSEADLADFAKPDDFEIDIVFAGVSAAKRAEWLHRYNSKGGDAAKYWHVFRRFIWNEANEIVAPDKTVYRDTEIEFFAPELTGIADTPETPGSKWYRRRRKMLDTLYLKNKGISQWERHPPALWMAAAPEHDSDEWAGLKWRRITESHYNIDKDRCAVTFTVDDIAEWRPFDKQDSGEDEADQDWPDDPRTFATLLFEGTLRFCIECSVPTDDAMIATADPTDAAGAPFPREIWIPANNNFVNTLVYDDGLANPSGLAISTLDMRADAQRLADITRDKSQNEAMHASVMTSGDWERQKIGTHITATRGGRVIQLSDKGGIGAQIVAIKIDPESYKYEYLTESLALAVKDREKKLLDRSAQIYKNAKRSKS